MRDKNVIEVDLLIVPLLDSWPSTYTKKRMYVVVRACIIVAKLFPNEHNSTLAVSRDDCVHDYLM